MFIKQKIHENYDILYERLIYQKVKSSNIKKVGYDKNTNILSLEFKNGDVYHYDEVPEIIFKKLIKAKSKGKFAFKNVNYSFNYEKIN